MVLITDERDAKELVGRYMDNEEEQVSVQQILAEGRFPELKGFIASRGKVTWSIFGGEGSFTVDGEVFDREIRPYLGSVSGSVSYDEKTESVDGRDVKKVQVDFRNPQLVHVDSEIPLRFMVGTGDISTHDIVRGTIPFKAQVNALIHNMMRRVVADYLGNTFYDVPRLNDGSVVRVAENLELLDFENVLRSHAAKTSTSTSLFVRYFVYGEREFCGHDLSGLKLFPNGPIDRILDTPSTKSHLRDESVAPEVLYELGIITPGQYTELRERSTNAYRAVSKMLLERGIILADTKLEHAKDLRPVDEIFNPDSSRFWLAEDYNYQVSLFLSEDDEGLEKCLNETQPDLKRKDYVWMIDGSERVIPVPKSFSKEVARVKSVGHEKYIDEQRRDIAVRYLMSAVHLRDQSVIIDARSWNDQVYEGLEAAVQLARVA